MWNINKYILGEGAELQGWGGGDLGEVAAC